MPDDAPRYDHNPGKSSSGPFIGIIIILLVMLGGAIYFAKEQRQVRERDVLPYITAGDSTTTPENIGTTTADISTSTVR